jgi:hypothetical protein
MKPRVFVSSTYFDLKHVRERIERFIENYGFEPVLFESDNVVFEHNKPLDLSCYNEVKLCHMMILIIGGRYGSIISGDNITENKESYDNDYISITRKEFETASKMNIPIFVFIEKNVYAEYHTYNKNKKFFDTQINSSPEKTFSFAHVDDVNVFKFINSVERIALKTFEKIEDIENYLQNQIAGMLYLYLQQLQDNINEEKILDSVSELKSISKSMNEMISAVGKIVIQDNSFEKVLFDQNKILIEFYVEQFIDNITFKFYQELSIEDAEKIYELSMRTLFDYEKFKFINLEKDWNTKWNLRTKVVSEFQQEMYLINEKLQLEEFNYAKIYENYFKKVYPLIMNQPNLMEYFKSKFTEEIKDKIYDLSF